MYLYTMYPYMDSNEMMNIQFGNLNWTYTVLLGNDHFHSKSSEIYYKSINAPSFVVMLQNQRILDAFISLGWFLNAQGTIWTVAARYPYWLMFSSQIVIVFLVGLHMITYHNLCTPWTGSSVLNQSNGTPSFYVLFAYLTSQRWQPQGPTSDLSSELL